MLRTLTSGRGPIFAILRFLRRLLLAILGTCGLRGSLVFAILLIIGHLRLSPFCPFGLLSLVILPTVAVVKTILNLLQSSHSFLGPNPFRAATRAYKVYGCD